VCPAPVKIELPKLNLDKFTDSYFKAAEDKQKGKKGADEFFKKGEWELGGRWTVPGWQAAAGISPSGMVYACSN
jgi:hypothetical protein